MRKSTKHKILFFFFVLIGLIAGYTALYISVSRFNEKERTMPVLSSQTETKGKDESVAIKPRGGSTDSWVKKVAAASGGEDVYQGAIYDVVVQNHSSYEMTDWNLKVEAKEDCYINNAWCGKVEIHQHTKTTEKVQTLDLRTCEEQGITYKIDVQQMDSDLMIPLDAGDYFIYYPSAAAKEEKLPESVSETADVPEIKVGFIAYYAGDKKEEGLTFSSGVLTYHLHETATDIPAAGVLFGITVLWILGIIVCVMVEIKTRQLVKEAENNARIIKQSMSAFMGFIDAKDSSTNGHSKRVAVYAKKLAQKYGLSKEEVQNIFYMGLMHDCGKIRVPDSILCKKGKLTDEEFGIMKTHTTEGAKLLSGFTSIPQIREAVLYHHERYDGRGYPEGLKGEEIPLVARILCVADSFDAMNSNRCYRDRLTKEQILEQLRSNRGTQFDPEIVDCMLELLDSGEITFHAEET